MPKNATMHGTRALAMRYVDATTGGDASKDTLCLRFAISHRAVYPAHRA
jgi:hypothetical protein